MNALLGRNSVNGYRLAHRLYWFVEKKGGSSTAEMTVSGSDLTISGLTSGTYTVYFVGECGGSKSDIIIFDDLII